MTDRPQSDTLAAALPREISSALRAQTTRQAEKLLALQRVDEAGLLVFGDDAGRAIPARSVFVRGPFLRTAILCKSLAPDAFDGRRFLWGQLRPTGFIARHERLPLCFGRRGVSRLQAFQSEVSEDVTRSEGQGHSEAGHG